MDPIEVKKNCAKAALEYIENNTIIGLGGGSTISYLIDYILAEDLNVKVVTPSFQTKQLCLKKGLEVMPTFFINHIDLAFDGCDEVDQHLHALKSGGGIHTTEKLIGKMSDQYVLLADENKFSETLSFEHPVCLEILKDAITYIDKAVRELGGEPALRKSAAKDGYTITDNGHYLMDVQFKEVKNVENLDKALKNLTGVLETSLFVNVATKAMIASESGIRIVEKPNTDL